MMRLRTALPALLTIAIAPVSALASTDWIEEHSRSIARVTFIECTLVDACDNLTNLPKRTGTGFLVDLPDRRTGIVTALHVVAGKGVISYQFQVAGGAPTQTEIIAINRDHDVAVLAPKALPSGVKPLRPYPSYDQGDEELYVIGYAYEVGTPIDSRGRGRALGRTLADLLPAHYASLLRGLRFPGLEAPIIGIDNALGPGDSGAPVFNEDGNLVGIGNGGIPESKGYISWAMPIAALENLAPHSGQFVGGSNAKISPLGYSAAVDRVFSIDEYFERDRPLATPIAYFALRFDMSEGALGAYIRDIEALSKDYLYRRAEDGQETFFRGVPILPDERIFPGTGGMEQHKIVLDSISRLRLHLRCYSTETFFAIIGGDTQFGNADPILELKFPIGNIEQRIKQEELELSITHSFDTLLNLSTLEPVELNTFMPGVLIRDNYRKPTDLLAGVCHVDLDGRLGVTSEYERALAHGAGLIRFQLTELMAFDLWPPALVPRAGNTGMLDLWASLPPRPIRTRDDGLGIFESR